MRNGGSGRTGSTNRYAPRMTRARHRGILTTTAVCAAAALVGCTRYTTPGGPADFRALGITPAEADAATDPFIAERMAVRPLAAFPASIASVRLQDRNYGYYSGNAYVRGSYAIVTNREAESQEAFDKIAALPMVRSLVPLNRLVLPDAVQTSEDLRKSAAVVHCDMLLVYTLDTRFGSETIVPYVGAFTLGLFPNKEARVTSTASAALIDTRSGYIYGLAEATHKTDQLANAWTSDDAVEQSRRRAEAEALKLLAGEIETMWAGVAREYGPPAAAAR